MRITYFSFAFCALLALTAFSFTLNAGITLPKIFSSNMVLQRDRPLKIWGWADAGEAVKVEFNGQTVKAKASKSGAWVLMLSPMKHGGPFVMTVTGASGKVTFQNVLIGDVWLGSGQSNMEWIMANTNNAQTEIAAANYPKIRLFTVEKAISYSVEKDIPGGPWLECTPQTVEFFSAVAYYFGRKIHEEIDVPIGLINSSWGGTKVEPWISWDLMQLEDEYKHISPAENQKMIENNKKNQVRYNEAVRADVGVKEKWFDPGVSTPGWKSVTLPNEWGNTSIGNVDGVVWFRKEVQIPPSAAEKNWKLSLGPIDDIDFTYVNGIEVGSMTVYNHDRVYTLKPGILKPGKNLIVIKVVDGQGGGGLVGKPEQLVLDDGGEGIPLSGEWQFKTAATTGEFGIKDTGPNSFGSILYNSMIAPIIQYPIRGVIWYQGEANTEAAYKYRRLFPTLIKDWRSKWGYDFSFLWVQLANFMKPSEMPSESSWAELREAQHMTLSVPKTGEAVIIDIGDADDIHPRNKKDVGIRLALRALKVEYGKQVVDAGPEFKSMTVEGDRALLTFSNAEGLTASRDKYGYVRGFAVAGEDRKFYWAKADIKDDKVIVHSDSVSKPVAVRYAWADNPDDANLYNAAKLPASPFRTDNWKGVTENSGK
jgi:sialate O-acetylesterase